MSRKKSKIYNKFVFPDPKFYSFELAKFINILMKSGKKSISEKIVYSAMKFIEKNLNKNALDIFNKSLEAIKPVIEIKRRRIGTSNFQIPMEIHENRRLALAMKWIKESIKKRKEKDMYMRLANELIDTINGKSNSLKKKQEAHKIAESNRTFSNYKL